VVGGRDGFRLPDYGNRNQDRPDVEFGESLPDGSHGVPFTLNMANQWGTGFQYLPVIEETKIDPKTGSQTIYVYSYYIEETDCNPKDFYPVFRDSSGAMVGDANSPIEYTTQLTAENVRKTIDVTLKKVSTDHLDDATEPPTLQGATFQLEKYTANTFIANDTTWGNNGVMFLSDDDEDGIFTFEGLSTGYYKVVEVSVPAGYVKLSEDPTFEVRLNADELEVILLNSDGTDADNNQTDMLRVNELIIRYGNPPGAVLPNAGGPGTRAFTILGSILILGAGVLLWRRRRLI
jgi:LPXTG-motif cell wall-anchored protein